MNRISGVEENNIMGSLITRCCSHKVIRLGRMKGAGLVPLMREMRNAYTGLSGKYEGQRPIVDLCVRRRQY
jgi:hypothetical protein